MVVFDKTGTLTKGILTLIASIVKQLNLTSRRE